MTLAADFFPKVALPVEPVVSADRMLRNVRSALTRGLRELQRCPPHGGRLSVMAGGPSLRRTFPMASGRLAAVNGSLGYLLEQGRVPFWCGVCDPGEHMADIVAADPRVGYFVASACHPALFDKLTAARCHVYLWHVGGIPGVAETLAEWQPDPLLVGGGTTMGLRWLNLGYVLGYRDFELHGLDSSFEVGATHAYPDRRDGMATMEVNGFRTALNFVVQAEDFGKMLDVLAGPDADPMRIEVLGDGLLPARWKAFRAANPGAFRP